MQQSLLREASCQHVFRAAHRPQAVHKRAQVCKASLQTPQQQTTRRQLLEASSMLAAALTLLPSAPAYAGLDRYVKKKKLDPLETYVPLVLEARERLAGLDDVMIKSPSEARQLMRSGPFSGLRDNIRALGQYAATPADQGGSSLPDQDASALVASFFRALEDYDLVLYNAVRDAKAAEQKAGNDAEKLAELDPAAGLDAEKAKGKLQTAVQQLDQLIATVPADVLSRSRDVLDKVSKKAAAAGLST